MAQILANELPNDGIEWAKLCAADMLAMGLHWPMMAWSVQAQTRSVGVWTRVLVAG